MRRFWRVKYRFDLGMSLMPIINFALLVVTTAKVLGLRALPVLLIAIPVAFLCVWALGYFLEKRMGAQAGIEENLVTRQPILKDHYRAQERIERKLDTIIRKGQA